MTPDGYPDESELAIIRRWNCAHNALGLIEYIRERWKFADYGYFSLDEKAGTLKLSTGGWSGNELIISALEENESLFWTIFWSRSERGGHYYFDNKLVADDLRWS